MKIEVVWLVIKFIALIFASFELFSIITNKNKKMSIAGTIVLAFSGCVMWNLDKIDSLILGEIITVLIYKIVTESKIKKIIPMMLGVILSSIVYMYTFRPFAISFGYVFFALILWIITKNRNEFKNNKLKIILLSLTCVISVISAICAEMFFKSIYMDNIQNNLSIGFSGVFTYLYTPLLGFNDVKDPGLWAGIISAFPIPMCLALYYMYKKEEHSEFLLPITIVTVLETVYCISGFPDVISKFTMLSGASAMRVVPAVQLANLFIIFYFLENVKETLFSVKHVMRITVVAICVLVIIKYPIQFAGKGFLYLFAAELTLLTFLFLNYSDKKYQKVFLVFLCLISLIGGIPALFLI